MCGRQGYRDSEKKKRTGRISSLKEWMAGRMEQGQNVSVNEVFLYKKQRQEVIHEVVYFIATRPSFIVVTVTNIEWIINEPGTYGLTTRGLPDTIFYFGILLHQVWRKSVQPPSASFQSKILYVLLCHVTFDHSWHDNYIFCLNFLFLFYVWILCQGSASSKNSRKDEFYIIWSLNSKLYFRGTARHDFLHWGTFQQSLKRICPAH